MKPDCSKAMQQLIEQVRTAIPFDLPEANICSGKCNGCSQKLLEYLDSELQAWEYRLGLGDAPNFGDIHRIASTSKKIYKILQKNDLIEDSEDNNKY